MATSDVQVLGTGRAVARRGISTSMVGAKTALAMLALAIANLTANARAADEVAMRESASGVATVIEIRGAIGPATSDFFVRALDRAAERQSKIFIVELDTPGGLDTSMRDMIQAILTSSIPVAIYVTPSGARAASAGTYLLYASHIAAMAPATNLGAATPIDLMNPAPAPEGARDKGGSNETDKSETTDRSPMNAREQKVINDAVAYIRGLAELRGRNVEWAEAAVRSAASLSSADARKQNVIDIVAADIADLLGQIDGRVVKMPVGELTIESANLTVERIESDWRTTFLSAITNPNVAYVLMLIGIYGLLLEGYNPGAIVPGVVGAICLLLALFAFQVLSVNFVGLALILLGVILIVAESFVPSFGALGIGGIVAFVAGSIMLMETDVPEFRIATPVIAALGFVGGLIALGIVTFAVRSRGTPVVTGGEQLLREVGVAVDDFDGSGSIRVHGELWSARTRQPLRAGQRVKIVAVDGLTLDVEPL